MISSYALPSVRFGVRMTLNVWTSFSAYGFWPTVSTERTERSSLSCAVLRCLDLATVKYCAVKCEQLVVSDRPLRDRSEESNWYPQCVDAYHRSEAEVPPVRDRVAQADVRSNVKLRHLQLERQTSQPQPQHHQARWPTDHQRLRRNQLERMGRRLSRPERRRLSGY